MEWWEWLIFGWLSVINFGAAVLAWRSRNWAWQYKRKAQEAALASMEFKADARRSAEEAKKAAVRDFDNPILPFIPAEGWHEEHGQKP
jgi:hypothetical protein